MNRRSLLLAAALLATPCLAIAQDTSKAQPELPKEKLVIVTKDGKTHAFNVEMAVNEAQQTVGLMFRKSVAPDGGMLFVWDGVRDSTMWMRNTISPLDMVFINADGTIRRVVEDTVPGSLAIIESRGPVKATLELAAGTAKRLDIHAGDKVEQRVFQN
jgi:uncharacterized membrane protein (UPF0127 family)